MMDETEERKMIQYLKSLSNMNDGHGPVVPKFMADKLRAAGIHEGYVEAKKMKSA